MKIDKVANKISSSYLYPILNACFGVKTTPFIIGGVVLSALLVAIVLCLFNLFRLDQRLVFAIDSFEFSVNGTDTIMSVGKNSDICFHRIPQNYMSVWYDKTNKYFKWEIDSLANDSLCYYKINNVNPNLYKIENDADIQVHIKDLRWNIKSDTLKALLNNCSNEYIMLKNIIRLEDSLVYEKISEDSYTLTRFNSFIHIKHDWKGRVSGCELCVLDNFTKINNKGYCYAMSTKDLQYNDSTEVEEKKNLFKIQFYSISDFSYKAEVGLIDRLFNSIKGWLYLPNSQFVIDDISYVVKPNVITSEWGAGHYLLKPIEKDSIIVNFPKSIMYVENYDSLRNKARSTSGVITYNQNFNSFPANNILYIPPFSSRTSQSVSRIQFTEDGAVFCINNKNEKVEVGSDFNLLGPTMQRYQLNDVTGYVNCRIGIIRGSYIFSYLALPFFMFLIISFSSFYLFKKEKVVPNHTLFNVYQVKVFNWYYLLIALIAFAYGICKIMVCIKLSYTYPYFEKISNIATYNVALMLLLFYVLSLIINHKYIDCSKQSKGKVFNKKLIAILSVILPYILCLVGFDAMDNSMSKELLCSYFPDELAGYISNPFGWDKKVGMMDNHRSVIYMFGATIMICFIILVCVLFKEKITTKEPHRIQPNNIANNVQYNKVSKYPILYAICFLVCIGSLGFLIPGNYATVIITLLEILCLSKFLSYIDYTDRNIIKIIFKMFLVTLFLFVAALPADFGYITNIFAFFTFFITYFFLVQPSGNAVTVTEKRLLRRKENVVIFVTCIIAIILFIKLPSITSFFTKVMWGDTDTVSFERSARRMHLFADYDDLKQSGYRYADSDVEFMVVLAHYMNHESEKDPLDPNDNFLHSSISTGQSPVVLNDVSIQSSFFGSYGKAAYVVYFALLISLVVVVLTYSFNDRYYGNNGFLGHQRLLTKQMQWRLMALFMWVSTSFYIFLSYLGFLPFTGRLNPGFGVDSVGEALESAILLAFMTSGVFSVKK